jgi:hypothetical protein
MAAFKERAKAYREAGSPTHAHDSRVGPMCTWLAPWIGTYPATPRPAYPPVAGCPHIAEGDFECVSGSSLRHVLEVMTCLGGHFWRGEGQGTDPWDVFPGLDDPAWLGGPLSRDLCEPVYARLACAFADPNLQSTAEYASFESALVGNIEKTFSASLVCANCDWDVLACFPSPSLTFDPSAHPFVLCDDAPHQLLQTNCRIDADCPGT